MHIIAIPKENKAGTEKILMMQSSQMGYTANSTLPVQHWNEKYFNKKNEILKNIIQLFNMIFAIFQGFQIKCTRMGQKGIWVILIYDILCNAIKNLFFRFQKWFVYLK